MANLVARTSCSLQAVFCCCCFSFSCILFRSFGDFHANTHDSPLIHKFVLFAFFWFNSHMNPVFEHFIHSNLCTLRRFALILIDPYSLFKHFNTINRFTKYLSFDRTHSLSPWSMTFNRSLIFKKKSMRVKWSWTIFITFSI